MIPWQLAFPSAAAKLERAAELAQHLTREADAFRASRPYREVRSVDPATNELQTYAVVERQPPASWGLVLGDCVHNLRSALDHAVFGLSLACAGHELTEEEQRLPAFPACDTEGEWKKALTRPLRFVSAPVREEIYRHQPLTERADERGWAPVGAITRVDNADKHRALLLTASAVQISGVAVADGVAGRHRFTRAVDPTGSVVSRLPGDVDAGAARVSYDVHVRLDAGGQVRCPPLEEDEVDKVAWWWIGRVEYVLGRLALHLPVKSEVAGG
jgi:hypothetical protein